MSTIALSTTAAKALTAYATAGTAFRNKTKLAVDALVADGIKPEDMEAPGKEGDRTFYDSCLAFIQAGMGKDASTLIDADPKALTEEKKVERRYQMMQRASLLKDIRKSLKNRLEAASRGPRQSHTVAERILKRLEEVRAIIQKAEDPDFEVVKLLAGLDQLAKLLK